MTFSFSIIAEAWPTFMAGLLTTAVFCSVSSVLGLGLAVPIALAQLSRSFAWRLPAKVIVEIVRDTPFLVQVFVIYFVLPAAGLPVSSTAAGILALTIHGAVYFSESIRGAILSVPKGQVDAARATGMSYPLTLRRVVFPQMMGYVLPSIGNQLVGLIKDSAVLSIISVPELSMAFNTVLGTTFAAPESFVTVAVLYWLLTSAVTLVMSRLERMTPTHRSTQELTSLIAGTDR
ncbi:MAG TPA: amino acid ABC transporter permease [Reyranella sp.]|nr:amino acid ABC transporter permease [Reyranella sp.]